MSTSSPEANAMKKRLTGTALLVASCLLLSMLGLAQTPRTPDTENITISVVVTDASDLKAVTGLDLKAFRVLEDQVEQMIVSVKENTLAGDYTITYTPKNSTNDGTWRRVRVQILMPGGRQMTVRHSQGYYARPK
jgi:hypothetical protein